MSIEVPETQTPNTVLCGHCNAPNVPSRNFCGRCGQGLWEVCAGCQQRTSAGEAFCGSCGGKLDDSLSRQVELLEQTLLEVERLAMEFEFTQALAQLEPVLQINHPRLQTLVERARAQRERLRREFAERKQEAAAAFEAAQAHLTGNDFRRALLAVKSVAEPLRFDELNELRTQLMAREESCRALFQQIRAKLDAKATGDLLPMVEEYLLLDPQHADMAKLAEKLRVRLQQHSLQQRDKLCEAARTSLQRFEYQKAADQLRMVPQDARQGIYFNLLEQAEELSYLAQAIKEAPHVDRVLVKIAERLLKHAPEDKQTAKKLAELRQRIDTTSRNPHAGAPEWTVGSANTTLGMPVEWWGGFARLVPKDVKLREQLAAAPGRFFIAAGMALQGLQRARVDINLLPAEKKAGLLDRLGKVGRTKPATAAWGIDLGATALKAVKLVPAADGRMQIEACELIEYEKELCRPDAQGQEKQIVAVAIRTFLERHQPDAKNERVAVNIPGGRILGRFLRIPRVKPAKVAELMQYEAGHQIPLPLESLCWGYQLLESEAPEDADSPMINCVLVAAQRGDAEQRLAWCQAGGLVVDSIQSECAALYNLAYFEHFDPAAVTAAGDKNAQVIFMDLGGDATQILIASRNSLWFRTLNRGTDDFTRRLIRSFNLTHDKAEPLKRNPAMAKQISKVYETLVPAMAEMENELRLTLTAFNTHQGAQDEEEAIGPACFYGCGGGFLTHGLLRYLRNGK